MIENDKMECFLSYKAKKPQVPSSALVPPNYIIQLAVCFNDNIDIVGFAGLLKSLRNYAIEKHKHIDFSLYYYLVCIGIHIHNDT